MCVSGARRLRAWVTIHEPELLGTAGTLLANRSLFQGATGLLIHADNAMAGDLQGLLTMLTFRTDQPRSCGIVATDERGVVTAFHEKVAEPRATAPIVLSMPLILSLWNFWPGCIPSPATSAPR